MHPKIGRRLFFWVLVFCFLATSVAVLFFTFGYSFDTKRKIFVHTGSFTLKTVPLDTIDIRIDGEEVSKRKLNILNNAYHVSGQMPGEHFIEITAPGYSTWKKKAVIESGKSTEFWNINLVATHYTTYSFPETKNVLKIFPSPKENLLAILQKENTTLLIKTFDSQQGVISTVAQLEQADFPESFEENLEWSPDTTLLTLPIFSNGTREYILVNRENNTVENILSRSGLSDMRFARWDARRNGILYFLSGSNLFEWDATDKTASPRLIAEQIDGYDISHQYLYTLDLSNGLVKRFRSGTSVNQSEFISLEPIQTAPDSRYDLTVYDEDRIAIRDRKTGELFIHNIGEKDHFERKEAGVRGIQFSNDGKKLLYFTDREIFVYFLRKWDTQPTRREGETLQIARFSEPIRFVQWAEDYEHVLFSLNTEIKTIELDGRDRRIAETAMTLHKEPQQFFANFSSNGIFLIEQDSSMPLSYFSFPENIDQPAIEIPKENTL